MLLNYATTCTWKISPTHVLVGKPLLLITPWFANKQVLLLNATTSWEISKLNFCSDVEIEPVVQDISGEHFNRGSNKAQDARLDSNARRFWESHRWSAFFDVRACHPNAVSYRHLKPQQIYRIHENEKKRVYSRRVLDVEHGTFTPLVFTTTGGLGRECLMYHSRLAQLIAIKNLVCYTSVFSVVMQRSSEEHCVTTLKTAV